MVFGVDGAAVVAGVDPLALVLLGWFEELDESPLAEEELFVLVSVADNVVADAVVMGIAGKLLDDDLVLSAPWAALTPSLFLEGWTIATKAKQKTIVTARGIARTKRCEPSTVRVLSTMYCDKIPPREINI